MKLVQLMASFFSFILEFFTSGDISSGFQSQSGQPYSHLAEAFVTLSLRLTSGVTLTDLLVTSMAAELISSTYLWAGIGGVWNWDLCAADEHSTDWAMPANFVFKLLSC